MLTTLLLAAALTWSPPASTHCLTYPEPTMGRQQTICDDGTRAVSTFNKTLNRWETTITPGPQPTRKEVPYGRHAR
jgi:hypothetical protein